MASHMPMRVKTNKVPEQKKIPSGYSEALLEMRVLLT
jgi:hypothetical protein